MRPVCIRNFKKPRRKVNQVNVRKDFWGFTFRLLFSWRVNWQGLRASGVVCVCFNQLLLFCFVVSFWSNRICSPWRSLQEPADQRGELSAKGTWEWPNPPVLYVSTRQSKCTRHWGSRQKRATCFATVLQNLRVLPLRNEPNLSCNISGSYRWRKVVAESRD